MQLLYFLILKVRNETKNKERWDMKKVMEVLVAVAEVFVNGKQVAMELNK
ncbi:hypothetical protein bthur0012_5000 [Bacillus thuringiensis serovar pulsiensis BGSC 4CC1]|nr:hypothetical protein bthur0012_5000 [Bacillus thuringiensis serovar pulsiensis BGSC 4CC1]